MCLFPQSEDIPYVDTPNSTRGLLSVHESHFIGVALLHACPVERRVLSEVHSCRWACPHKEGDFRLMCTWAFTDPRSATPELVQSSPDLRSASAFPANKRTIFSRVPLSAVSLRIGPLITSRKKVIVPPPLLHLHNWDWWEGKESVYSAGR